MSQYLEERRKRMLGIVTVQEPEKPKPIAKQSDKRKEQQKLYRQIVKEMLKDGVQCKVGAPGCTKKPSGCHHLQKRSPKNFLDKKNLIPCCTECNGWIERNSVQAADLGFTKSRFSK